jgi:hypothetical protein
VLLRAQRDLERAAARHRLHCIDRQVRETGLELFGVAFEVTVVRLAALRSGRGPGQTRGQADR